MSDDEDGFNEMFKEPDGFYKPENSPTMETHTMLSGEVLTFRLVGHSPLWVSL